MNQPTVQQLFDLTGRVALVTGAAGHLGQAFASALAEAGATVVATSRKVDRARELARQLPCPAQQRHVGVSLDHMDESSIERGLQAAVDQAGEIDILVNNGHEATAADWTNIQGDQFTRQLANASAYFLLARHVRNRAAGRKSPASIIMIGSMYGQVASYPDAYQDIAPASSAAYHALKGSIIHLTRHLAVYWADDQVRVNCLSPGPFPYAAASPELVRRLQTKSPLKRMGQPFELKGALLLLASDAGSYITGQNLTVDGGWTAW